MPAKALPGRSRHWTIITMTAAGLIGSTVSLHAASAPSRHATAVATLTAADVRSVPGCVTPAPGQPCVPAPAPAAYSLSPATANQIEEPVNDAWSGFLCGAGASTVALSYWNIDVLHYPKVTATDPGGTFTYDPAGTSPATDGHGRSYLMYLATQAKPANPPDPGNWVNPGEVTLNAADIWKSGANAEVVRDTLNWEASGHAANWQNYFYTVSYVGNDAQNQLDHSPDAGQTVTAATIDSHITADIGTSHEPVIAQVNDGDLPDWATSSSKGHGHLIAIIGYDNTAHTYTYVETCAGNECGTVQTDGPNKDGTGTHTIPQQQLFQAITDFPGEGALIW